MSENRISEEVLPILESCVCEGAIARLSGQLDRATYLAANKVLEGLGGHWNRRAKGHVFADGDAAGRIDVALATGTYERPENFDFFPAPPALAREVIRLAHIKDGMRVLEPSAGDGALCDAALLALDGSGCDVWDFLCFELRHDLREKLDAKGLEVHVEPDFLAAKLYAAIDGNHVRLARYRPFHRVVMNPPFSKQQDVDHVAEALKYLAPDGLLVAIMSASVEFRTTKKTVALRELIAARGGSITRNPEGSFRASGTNVNTVTVVIPGECQ